MRGEEAAYHLPMLKNIINIHHGFTKSSQCINSILGSHDQAGNRSGGQTDGKHGQYFVSLFGGRHNWHTRAQCRMWYSLQAVTAANKLRLEYPALTDEYCAPVFVHEDPTNRVIVAAAAGVRGMQQQELGMQQREMVQQQQCLCFQLLLLLLLMLQQLLLVQQLLLQHESAAAAAGITAATANVAAGLAAYPQQQEILVQQQQQQQ
ncbi:1,4-alpha-glucan branching enzyme, putative [Eimeria mitis]|uniref:1,4-alpha-glucan branching enzyme, putative n=1 Tax=Eimeria mitis TaxID=44415 RepID=U6JYS3_9EIME|nr:1,4-alpha-glucan branching enzyme, putative [Eimeria mitis]CDJ28678.1 1,4-alpha-glucan branching enzyme, putative [Eimeria mitis]